MREKIKLWFWLIKTNLGISAFTFGGGYVVIPMIRRSFVNKGLFTEEELMNMAAVAQSSPGAIAVNLAVLAGFRSAGKAGAVISGIAAVVPPLVILSVISVGYDAFAQNEIVKGVLRGMEAGVAALIADLLIDMWSALAKERGTILRWLAVITFAGNYFLQIPVLWLLGFCVLCCVVKWRWDIREEGTDR